MSTWSIYLFVYRASCRVRLTFNRVVLCRFSFDKNLGPARPIRISCCAVPIRAHAVLCYIFFNDEFNALKI